MDGSSRSETGYSGCLSALIPQPGWRKCGRRVRYTESTGLWQIYYPDLDLKFHRYDGAEPSPRVADLLEEIERDTTAIFWG